MSSLPDWRLLLRAALAQRGAKAGLARALGITKGSLGDLVSGRRAAPADVGPIAAHLGLTEVDAERLQLAADVDRARRAGLRALLWEVERLATFEQAGGDPASYPRRRTRV
jgi:hypothetical protein